MESDKEEAINSIKEDIEAPSKKEISATQKFFIRIYRNSFSIVFIVTGISVFGSRNNLVYNRCFESAFVLTSMIYIFGRVSGAHFNPAVTIPMFLRKKITEKECCYYI